MLSKGLDGVVGAGRIIAALSANERGQSILIEPDHGNKEITKYPFELLP
jgi:hypothetical protein